MTIVILEYTKSQVYGVYISYGYSRSVFIHNRIIKVIITIDITFDFYIVPNKALQDLE